ncbi:hypothetical protein B0A49_10422 [Cryomyces minteri]|uniref:Uncharacterized protein n=1 Tax=Cryomyces minteri TaxID=331657 RepID=A0A4U0WVS7_9PEZI|nr:hypothetical protein B0A49_10422 [Cryomyces minteri]
MSTGTGGTTAHPPSELEAISPAVTPVVGASAPLADRSRRTEPPSLETHLNTTEDVERSEHTVPGVTDQTSNIDVEGLADAGTASPVVSPPDKNVTAENAAGEQIDSRQPESMVQTAEPPLVNKLDPAPKTQSFKSKDSKKRTPNPGSPALDSDKAFITSASTGNLNMVGLLLGFVSSVDAKDKSLGTALQAAVLARSLEVVELLLSKGADPDVEGPHGIALKMCAVHGQHAIAKLLLEHGADPDMDEAEGALLTAVMHGHEAIVKPLLDAGADPRAGDVLQRAAQFGRTKIVEEMLDAGAEVNAIGKHQSVALREAVMYGREETVSVLLARGAEVDLKRGDDGTPLMDAVLHARPNIIKCLLANGADPKGKNVLQRASELGRTEVVTILFDAGTDIDGKGSHNATALRCAAAYGKEDIVRLLLSRGADVNYKGSGDDTALMLAITHSRPSIVKLLLDAGADFRGSSVLQTAVESGNVATVTNLLDAGVDVNARRQSGISALEAAARYGREEVVKLLLDRGADPNSKGPNGTALMEAIQHRRENVAKILLERVARP